MRYLFIFGLLSLTVSAACTDYAQNFTQVEIPSGIPYSNERVNVYISNDFYASIIIEDKILTSLDCELLLDPTYNVYLENEGVLTATYASVDEVMQLVNDGTVVIEPQTFVSNVKYTLSKMALKMVSWFW